MYILCVIPARGGSSRVKRKNVRLLKGLPLMTYTLRQAISARSVSRVVVSTEDNEIASIAATEGVDVIMRPAEYARNDSPIYFALRHAVRATENSRGCLADVVVWLQPNVPFREKDLIDNVIKRLQDNYEKADSVATVYRVDQHPELMKVMRDGYLEFRERPEGAKFLTQDLPDTYLLDGSVVAMKTRVLMDDALPQTSGHFYMGKTIPFIHGFPYTVEIDREDNFFLAEYVLDRKWSDQ